MEVKERIVQGAEELFFTYGVKSITMDAIASHVGISKKTLYENVKDKNTLVELVAGAHFDKEKCSLETIEKNSSNAIEEIHAVNLYIKSNFSRINPTLFYDIKRYHPTVWNIFHNKKHECIGGTLIGNLERGIEQGYYRSEIDAQVMARMRMKQVEWGFDIQEFPMTEFNFMDVQMQLLDHFLHGIVTEKGLKLYEQYKQQNEKN